MYGLVTWDVLCRTIARSEMPMLCSYTVYIYICMEHINKSLITHVSQKYQTKEVNEGHSLFSLSLLLFLITI